MGFSLGRSATNAGSCSVQFVSRAAANPARGVPASAEPMKHGARGASLAGRANMRAGTQDGWQNGSKVRTGKESFAGKSNVTENPLALYRKQRTCKGQNRLSRTTPLPGRFRPQKRLLARTGVQSKCSLPGMQCVFQIRVVSEVQDETKWVRVAKLRDVRAGERSGSVALGRRSCRASESATVLGL